MDLKVFLCFLIGLLLQGSVSAQFATCSRVRQIPSIGTSIRIDHAAVDGSCRYQVFSPPDSYIFASCTLTLRDTTCNNQRFGISRSGDINLNDANRYCSNVIIQTSSIGNEMVVAIIMSPNTASFTCTLNAVSATALNSGCDCGWNVNTKIVGGSVTGTNEFVSHAGIVINGRSDAYCGAVIVRQFFAITAAHCVAGLSPSSTSLAVGSQNIAQNPSDTRWAARYAIAQFISHGGYNASRGLNDIALVRTSSYIRYTPGVGPACIPYTFMNNDNYFNSASLTVVGWGTTGMAYPTSNSLLKAPLRVISTTECASRTANIDSTKICADGGRTFDSCGQDSGGGLYWQPSANKYVIGIVNNGVGCAAGYPSVNSRVTSYVGWLENAVQGSFCRKT